MTFRFGTINGCWEALPRIVSAKSMDALVRKKCVEWDCIFTMAKGESMSHAGDTKERSREIQQILDNYPNVFGEIPKGLLPFRGFDHMMELESEAKLVIVTPDRHLKVYKDEIEKTIKELLDMGFIRPSSSPFASSIVLVKKKDRTMQMCIDYRLLKKKTIKN